MASVNRVILIGHLGRDPEIRYLPSGDAVATISIATTETWKDKAGEKQEQTEWHRIVMFGKTAQIAGEYLKKSAQVYIEGKLQTKKWQDKEGKDRTTTEIRCDRMQMLGGKPSEATDGSRETADEYRKASGSGAQRNPPAAKTQQQTGFNDLEDDIPFVTASFDDDVIMRKLWWPAE